MLSFLDKATSVSLPVNGVIKFDTFDGKTVCQADVDLVQKGTMFVPNSPTYKLLDVAHVIALTSDPDVADQENQDPNLGRASTLPATRSKHSSEAASDGFLVEYSKESLRSSGKVPAKSSSSSELPDLDPESALASKAASMSLVDTRIPIVVTFLNTTISSKHAFSYDNYRDALERLADDSEFIAKYRIHRAQFYFVFPNEFRASASSLEVARDPSGFKTSIFELKGTPVQHPVSAYAAPGVTQACIRHYMRLASKK